MKKNYYEVLDINQNVQAEEIKKSAYRQLNEVTQAFKVLSDTDKRQAYDLTLQTTQPPTNNYYDLLSINQTTATAIIQPAALAQLDEIKVALGVLSNMEKRQAYDLTLQPTPPLEEISPYHPPATVINDTSDEKDDLENDNLEFELASRARRLSAVIINGIIMQLSLLFITGFSFFVLINLSGGTDKLLLIIPILWVSWVVFIVVINLILLYRHGQTIGKRLLSIKIVRSNDSRASLKRIIFLRFFIVWLIILSIAMAFGLLGAIIFWGSRSYFMILISRLFYIIIMIINILLLIDPLLIFRKDRRCLHDLIADTIVIKQPESKTR
jgi:uncharacterized RDD family membrane protein YckC